MFNVLSGRNGKVGFINEVMAVHRKRTLSLSSYYGASRLLLDKLNALEILRPYFPEHDESLAKAARYLRWKLRVARMGPLTYQAVRRIIVRCR
jgi:hypothetical protein